MFDDNDEDGSVTPLFATTADYIIKIRFYLYL